VLSIALHDLPRHAPYNAQPALLSSTTRIQVGHVAHAERAIDQPQVGVPISVRRADPDGPVCKSVRDRQRSPWQERQETAAYERGCSITPVGS
jgi:hypothetical protein